MAKPDGAFVVAEAHAVRVERRLQAPVRDAEPNSRGSRVCGTVPPKLPMKMIRVTPAFVGEVEDAIGERLPVEVRLLAEEEDEVRSAASQWNTFSGIRTR